MRQQVSIEEIKDALLAQLDHVVHHYAPPASGSFTKHGKYFTLNPGRADRSVGSFCVTMSGPKAGRWMDFATKEHGDILDLIRLQLGCDAAGAIKEARAFLGLDTESPELKRKREIAAARAKADRARAEARAKQAAEKARETARAIWLSGQEVILDTPVDHYLRGRGIDLRAFRHPPRAIRFHPACRYYFDAELVDDTTGEIRTVSQWRAMPAMVTAIAKGGAGIIDCHRTYLAQDPKRGWVKADLPDAKKVLTDYTGGAIRLCGPNGPRGGQTKLAKAPPGSRVVVTEGIENALSYMAIRAMTGRDPAFVVAAGSIWNMANIELPDTVTEVVLAADNDTNDQARAQLAAAVGFHKSRGRAVRVWRSKVPGNDLNDELQRVLQAINESAA